MNRDVYFLRSCLKPSILLFESHTICTHSESLFYSWNAICGVSFLLAFGPKTSTFLNRISDLNESSCGQSWPTLQIFFFWLLALLLLSLCGSQVYHHYLSVVLSSVLCMTREKFSLSCGLASKSNATGLGNLQKDRLSVKGQIISISISLFLLIYQSVKGLIEAVKIPVIMKLSGEN